MSLKPRGPNPLNFAISLVFLTLKNMLKDQLFKTSGLQLDNSLFGPVMFSGPRNRFNGLLPVLVLSHGISVSD